MGVLRSPPDLGGVAECAAEMVNGIEMISSLYEALRDRYKIERELGRGGMATVYQDRQPLLPSDFRGPQDLVHGVGEISLQPKGHCLFVGQNLLAGANDVVVANLLRSCAKGSIGRNLKMLGREISNGVLDQLIPERAGARRDHRPDEFTYH